jgi:L-amino acid N-acyltransferase YncA
VVQTEGGDFVGLTMYYFREGEWRGRVVHLAFTGVIETFRGCGLSLAISKAAASHFGNAGCRGISTHIYRDNPPPLVFARRQGFQESGTSPQGGVTLFLPLP